MKEGNKACLSVDFLLTLISGWRHPSSTRTVQYYGTMEIPAQSRLYHKLEFIHTDIIGISPQYSSTDRPRFYRALIFCMYRANEPQTAF